MDDAGDAQVLRHPFAKGLGQTGRSVRVGPRHFRAVRAPLSQATHTAGVASGRFM